MSFCGYAGNETGAEIQQFNHDGLETDTTKHTY